MSESLFLDLPPYESLEDVVSENLETIIEWSTYEFKPEDADMLDLEKRGLENVFKISMLASVFAGLMQEKSPGAYRTIYRSVAFAFAIAELVAPQNFDLDIGQYHGDSDEAVEKIYELQEDVIVYLESVPTVRGLLNTYAEDLYNSGLKNEFDLVAIPFGAVFMLAEQSLQENYLHTASAGLEQQ
ncbi:MAG: hypothetical protein U0520_05210 [Candidatus Saccharimonadales bacterium]